MILPQIFFVALTHTVVSAQRIWLKYHIDTFLLISTTKYSEMHYRPEASPLQHLQQSQLYLSCFNSSVCSVCPCAVASMSQLPLLIKVRSKRLQLHAAHNNTVLCSALRHQLQLTSCLYTHFRLTSQLQSTPQTVCQLYFTSAGSTHRHSDCALLCRTAQEHKQDGAPQ